MYIKSCTGGCIPLNELRELTLEEKLESDTTSTDMYILAKSNKGDSPATYTLWNSLLRLYYLNIFPVILSEIYKQENNVFFLLYLFARGTLKITHR